jgi:hypothetical protein
MRHLERNGYTAFDWAPEEMRLDGLLAHFPELVVGRYVAVLSFDSGPLVLSAEEEKKGWRRIGAIAFSPRITDIRELPFDSFDEWLVFDSTALCDQAESLVSFYGFSPIDFAWEEKKELFWSQLSRLSPISVIGDGSVCYLVTRQSEVIEQLKMPIQPPQTTPGSYAPLRV